MSSDHKINDLTYSDQGQVDERTLDPNVSQSHASDPSSSVWVNASAGTGKTKVLTDRVLRLMMPDAEDYPGAAVHKILCLTFTKAAASEMLIRIRSVLSGWVSMKDEELSENLQKLLRRSVSEKDLGFARSLFTKVIDDSIGLKVMTVHSFCQSVLGRFPLEAGVPPYMSIIEDDEADALLIEAKQKVFETALTHKASDLYESLKYVMSQAGEETFDILIDDVLRERYQLSFLLENFFGVEGIYSALCRKLDVPAGRKPSDLIEAFCYDVSRDTIELKATVSRLKKNANTINGKKSAKALDVWLNMSIAERVEAFESLYVASFLTQARKPYAKLAGSKFQKDYPEDYEVLVSEQEKLMGFLERLSAAICAEATRSIIYVGAEIISEYQAIKSKRSVFDYTDLINKTITLLKNHKTSWVMYKMDQGIDHILVDEAQDTNPEQWQIVETLSNEFYAGKGANDALRTIFVVGDEKQSIYSFQRASPQEFSRMRSLFRLRTENADESWTDVPLDISFRSVKTVLRAVDRVFSKDNNIKSPLPGMGQTPLLHKAYRVGMGGKVVLWPPFEYETQKNNEIETPDIWDNPFHINENRYPPSRLAQHIASEIRGWLDNKEILEARGRPIKPEDIMILVRKRKVYVSEIMRALQVQGIPVGGADRIRLCDTLAVEDLFALASCALYPIDDLMLATVLRSPLIDLSEDNLYDLAVDRGEQTLWGCLKNTPRYQNIFEYLEGQVKEVKRLSPYAYFSKILNKPCPANDYSGMAALKTRLGSQVNDPVNELLNLALAFENKNDPSVLLFIHRIKKADPEIKREVEAQGEGVRIMTVHGSKGLQAPIVILPDTMHASSGGAKKSRFMWPDKSGLELPLWSPSSMYDCNLYQEAKEHVKLKEEEEYRRLLYVAMTRAEDRLYVGGAKGKQKPMDLCWYNLIEAGLRSFEDVREDDDGTLSIYDPQTRPPVLRDYSESKDLNIKINAPVPKWLNFTADGPEVKAESLSGDMQDIKRADASFTDILAFSEKSPASGVIIEGHIRGAHIHKILEFLPNMSEGAREQGLQRYFSGFMHQVSVEERREIAYKIKRIIEDPVFHDVFSARGREEVDFIYTNDEGKLSKGRIDRLVVNENEVFIVDYKTGMPPNGDTKIIPDAYREQLKKYSDAMSVIYPNHDIKAAILWTDIPALVHLNVN